VEENLTHRRHTLRGALGTGVKEDPGKKVYAYFPRLKERRISQSVLQPRAGEQQMTAIGRALMARPNMILARRALDGPRAAV